MTDYPQGDGHPDCKECQGRGVVAAKPKASTVTYPCVCTAKGDADPKCKECQGEGVRRERAGPLEVSKPCSCVYIRDVLLNMERGWRKLIKGEPVDGSPLRGKENSDLWVTATKAVFRNHLKHVAARMGPNWRFLVKTDADLMDAWLSPRLEVMDADVASARMKTQAGGFHALVDLVEPPELLILLVGVKTARNEAMPEVLLEAMRHREHRELPTWVVDRPDVRITDTTHLSHSAAVISALQDWGRVKLDEEQPLSKLLQGMPPLSEPEPPPEPEEEADVYEAPSRTESSSTSGQPVMGLSDETRSLMRGDEAEPPAPKGWKSGRRK